MKIFTATLWRALVVTTAGTLWFLYGSWHGAYARAVFLPLALGLTVGIILMIACDQVDVHDLRDTQSELRVLMKLMRRRQTPTSTPPGGTPVAHASRHTPPPNGNSNRVTPPFAPEAAPGLRVSARKLETKQRWDWVPRWRSPRRGSP